MKDRRTFLARALLVLAIAIASTGCHRHRDWPKAEEFTRKLRCGMSVAEVRLLASSLGAAEFKQPELAGRPGVPDYFTSKNERLVSLWFGQHGLVAYMSSVSSMEHSEESEMNKIDLCQP